MRVDRVFGSDISRHEISYCLCGCVVVHLRKLTRYVVGIPYARLLYSMFVVVVVGRRERDMYALTICSLLIISFFLVLCGFSRFYYYYFFFILCCSVFRAQGEVLKYGTLTKKRKKEQQRPRD